MGDRSKPALRKRDFTIALFANLAVVHRLGVRAPRVSPSRLRIAVPNGWSRQVAAATLVFSSRRTCEAVLETGSEQTA